MNAQNLSGLELMQAVAKGALPLASIAETIPMTLGHAEKGRVEFTASADERHLNPMGGVHGGFAATIMDSVTGCAVHTMLEPGVGYGTIDLNVKMLRPVPRDVALTAHGKVLNVSKSIAVSEGTLKDSDGKLYAHATATCKILRPNGA